VIKDARARQRRHRMIGVALLAAGGIAALLLGSGWGGGGGDGRQHTGLGSHSLGTSTPPAARGSSLRIVHVRGSAAVCTPRSSPPVAGDPPPGQCVIQPASGGRFECPVGVENSFGADGAEVAASSACHRLAPPTIPASWGPTIVRMNQVKACLRRGGLTVAGSPTPPDAQRAYPDTPIAALLIAGASPRPSAVSLVPAPGHADTRPTTVDFYLTTAQARRAYRRFLPTVARQAQGIARRGGVLYAWNHQSAGQAATERSCVRAG